MTDQQEQQQSQIVEDILAAKTLYDVLGVTPNNLEESTLRRAYLKTSVKVHPDKNSHPQATQAFQRVAEAWGTLNDPSARAAYDAELRNPSSSSSNYNDYQQQQSTHYANDFERTHMPSFQEALFLFATVTTMFSSSAGAASRSGSAVNAASDFVETLYWAQKLAQGRNTQSMDHDDDNNPDRSVNASNNDPFTSGMALGSGLRAFASAQRAFGMKKSAMATERAATGVQVAAMGAGVMKAAGENPAVQRTLERGQAAFQNNPQLAKGVRASLKMAGSVLAAFSEAQREAQAEEKERNGNSSGYGAGANKR